MTHEAMTHESPTRDYIGMGLQLDTISDSADLAAFARRNGTSTDETMRTLAAFALHKCSAICHERAGRSDEVMIYRGYAEAEYNKLPAAARW